MKFKLILDYIYPRLEERSCAEKIEEHAKLCNEEESIAKATASLPNDFEELKYYLETCERLLNAELTRKTGVEARLLNTAGLVSIAGTVVMGAMFSLAIDKKATSSPPARILLAFGCLYLTLQLVSALFASVNGLRSRAYENDQPHELLPRKNTKHNSFLRHRIRQVLVRLSKHRRLNDDKVSQLNVAHAALSNFIMGLLAVAVIAFFASFDWDFFGLLKSLLP